MEARTITAPVMQTPGPSVRAAASDALRQARQRDADAATSESGATAEPRAAAKRLGRPVPRVPQDPEQARTGAGRLDAPEAPHRDGADRPTRLQVPDGFLDRAKTLLESAKERIGEGVDATEEASADGPVESEDAPSVQSTVATESGDVDIRIDAEVPEGATPPDLTSMSWSSDPGDFFSSSQTDVQLTATDADGEVVIAEDDFSMDGEWDGHDNATLVVEANGYEWTYSAEFDNGGAWTNAGSWNPQELVLVDVQPAGENEDE